MPWKIRYLLRSFVFLSLTHSCGLYSPKTGPCLLACFLPFFLSSFLPIHPLPHCQLTITPLLSCPPLPALHSDPASTCIPDRSSRSSAAPSTTTTLLSSRPTLFQRTFVSAAWMHSFARYSSTPFADRGTLSNPELRPDTISIVNRHPTMRNCTAITT